MALYDFIKKNTLRITRGLGFEVMRYNLRSNEDVLLKTIIRNRGIKTILDVGANEGQYGEKLFSSGYEGTLYSFEPIKGVFEKLQKNSAGNPKWKTFNVGLGSAEAELMINVTENFASSSLFKVGEQSLKAEPRTRITHQEKIRITTIDKFFQGQEKPESKVMLKLDIQGFELEALKGTETSLPKFDVVQVELSFTPVYEGAPLYREVIDYLESRGFSFFSFIPVFIDSETGQMLQADGIFVRKS